MSDTFTGITAESRYYELKNLPKGKSSYFSVLHSNVRSLKKNIDKLQSCIFNTETTFSVIGITETWLKENEALLPIHNLKGYNFVSRGRNDRLGGGVGIFIKKSLKYKIREDLNLFELEV